MLNLNTSQCINSQIEIFSLNNKNRSTSSLLTIYKKKMSDKEIDRGKQIQSKFLNNNSNPIIILVLNLKKYLNVGFLHI